MFIVKKGLIRSNKEFSDALVGKTIVEASMDDGVCVDGSKCSYNEWQEYQGGDIKLVLDDGSILTTGLK